MVNNLTTENLEKIFGKGIVKRVFFSEEDMNSKYHTNDILDVEDNNAGDNKYVIYMPTAANFYIEFTNGKVVEFTNSEWVLIYSVD